MSHPIIVIYIRDTNIFEVYIFIQAIYVTVLVIYMIFIFYTFN